MDEDDLFIFNFNQDRLYRHLSQGKDINDPYDESGRLMLIDAAREDNRPDFVNMLLRLGADVFRRDASGNNAIEAAFLNDDTDVLNAVVKGVPLSKDLQELYLVCTGSAKELDSERLNLSKKYPGGRTLLTEAVNFNRPLHIIKRLIDKDGNVNLRDDNGQTALFHTEDWKTIRLLLENGADMTVKDKDGNMFFDDIGIFDDMLPVIRVVSEQKPPLEIINRIWGKIALAISGMGFDAGSKTDSVYPPSYMIKVFRLLLNAGADINHLYGDNPEYIATMLNQTVKFGHISMVKYLLKRGADPNTVDGMGCTALICCAYEAAGPKVAKMLIKAGANPYFLWRNKNDPEDCRTFMDMIKNQPYYDEIVAYYEKIEKRAEKCFHGRKSQKR